MIPAEVRRALIEHAHAEAPNEACGLVAVRDEVVEHYVPCINLSDSRYRFTISVPDPYVPGQLEDEGYTLGVFHSHPSSPPHPSRTDVENIGLWEGRPYLILNVATGELAAWRIADGEYERVTLEEAGDVEAA